MALSSIGVGSGLPLNELLSNLRAAESSPLTLLKNRTEAVQNRISAYGTIKNALEGLQTAANDLANVEAFSAHATRISGEGFTASASTKATVGNYSINVNQLATRQALTSQGLDSRSRTLSTTDVTLNITVGTSSQAQPLTLAQNATTLDGIAAAINGQPGLGIRATVINDGSAQPYRLLITAAESGDVGSVRAITFTGIGAESELARMFGFNANTPEQTGGLTQATEGRPALININGINISNQSNTIENAIEGITLQLSNTTGSVPTTLSVTRDDKPALSVVERFVSAYNNLQNVIANLTSYNVESQSASALTGDSLARRVQTQMRDTLNVALDSGELRTLSQLGITTEPSTGMLTLDRGKLALALDANPNDVTRLFSGTNGIASRVTTAANLYLKSDGIINTATGGMSATLKGLQDQYNSTSDRIDRKLENYRQQFVQLDTLIAQMSSVSNYLTQQLSMLGAQNKTRS
ncbi:flagellar filament capping protein FliD [Alcaligenaceae bacterium]|nr:flagellar filament capping protein FliD [Alcaligenaceae bacterium]